MCYFELGYGPSAYNWFGVKPDGTPSPFAKVMFDQLTTEEPTPALDYVWDGASVLSIGPGHATAAGTVGAAVSGQESKDPRGFVQQQQIGGVWHTSPFSWAVALGRSCTAYSVQSVNAVTARFRVYGHGATGTVGELWVNGTKYQPSAFVGSANSTSPVWDIQVPLRAGANFVGFSGPAGSAWFLRQIDIGG